MNDFEMTSEKFYPRLNDDRDTEKNHRQKKS